MFQTSLSWGRYHKCHIYWHAWFVSWDAHVSGHLKCGLLLKQACCLWIKNFIFTQYNVSELQEWFVKFTNCGNIYNNLMPVELRHIGAVVGFLPLVHTTGKTDTVVHITGHYRRTCSQAGHYWQFAWKCLGFLPKDSSIASYSIVKTVLNSEASTVKMF